MQKKEDYKWPVYYNHTNPPSSRLVTAQAVAPPNGMLHIILFKVDIQIIDILYSYNCGNEGHRSKCGGGPVEWDIVLMYFSRP